MSASHAFYEGVYSIGHGIVAAFNRVSGNTALGSRNLDRPDDGIATFMMGAVTAVVGTIVVAAAVAPVAGVLTTAFAAVALAEAVFLPAQLQTAYLVGRDDEYDRKAARKASLG